MNVYILSIDHEIQKVDGRTDPAQKHEFEKLLRELVAEHHVEFIGDETYPDVDATAKHVGIQWEAIEVPQQARNELGITREQQSRKEWDFDPESGKAVWVKPKRLLSDGIREAYMVWRTLTRVGLAQSIMILCGRVHSEELRQRFENEGCQVITDSLCKRSWYKHPDC